MPGIGWRSWRSDFTFHFSFLLIFQILHFISSFWLVFDSGRKLCGGFCFFLVFGAHQFFDGRINTQLVVAAPHHHPVIRINGIDRVYAHLYYKRARQLCIYAAVEKLIAVKKKTETPT